MKNRPYSFGRPATVRKLGGSARDRAESLLTEAGYTPSTKPTVVAPMGESGDEPRTDAKGANHGE